MSEAKKKAKNITLLDVRKLDTKNGKKTVIQFSKDVEITFKGQKVDLGEFRTFFVKNLDEINSDLDFLVSKEYISEDQAEKSRDMNEKRNVTGSVKATLA